MEPLAPTQSKPVTMNFYDALRRISEGKLVKRISWANGDYCLLNEGYLSIYKNKEGKIHAWMVNDGDMEGEDWIITTEPN